MRVLYRKNSWEGKRLRERERGRNKCWWRWEKNNVTLKKFAVASSYAATTNKACIFIFKFFFLFLNFLFPNVFRCLACFCPLFIDLFTKTAISVHKILWCQVTLNASFWHLFWILIFDLERENPIWNWCESINVYAFLGWLSWWG